MRPTGQTAPLLKPRQPLRRGHSQTDGPDEQHPLWLWGKAPDLGNFRRKVLATPGFVTEALRSPDAAAGPTGGRPPLLYRRSDAVTLHPPMLRPAEGSHDDPA